MKKQQRTNTGMVSPSRASNRSSVQSSKDVSGTSQVVDALRAGGETSMKTFVEKARRIRNDGTLAGIASYIESCRDQS